MPVLVSMCWSALLAACVFLLLSRDHARRIEEATDETFGAAVSGLDPSFAAGVTFLVGIAAPFFLYQSRGVKGLLQGLALVLLGALGSAACQIGLFRLAHPS